MSSRKTRIIVGNTSLVEHEIYTGNPRPVSGKCYRLLKALRHEAEKCMSEILKAGIIKPKTRMSLNELIDDQPLKSLQLLNGSETSLKVLCLV